MSHIKTAFQGYATYRGREGQISFMLHRLTGLGTLLFLAIHILDTALVYFKPELYGEAIAIYRTTLFGIAEVGLVFSVLFHGVNGIRVAYSDLIAPRLWSIPRERWSTKVTLLITILIWLPASAVMIYNLLRHNYGLFGG